jgi:hypothetical protein
VCRGTAEIEEKAHAAGHAAAIEKRRMRRADRGDREGTAGRDQAARRFRAESEPGRGWQMNAIRMTDTGTRARGERGSAMIAALMIVSMLTILGLSMLSTGLSGTRSLNGQSDDYRLQSAVESVGTLATEQLWSAYLRQHGGAAGTIDSFRNYMTSIGIQDSGPGGAPSATDGADWLHTTGIPNEHHHSEFDDVNVDDLRVLRRDDGESTRLYVTVSASSNRGHGISTHMQNRAIQMVYTVEPAAFEGFDYGILSKNVNCIFCHARIDTTDRVYNHDPSLYNTFDKVKVGTLESLMLRNDNRPSIGDFDADSLIAGTLYVRGSATDQSGVPVNNWPTHTAMSCLFDTSGHIIQDDAGNITYNHFHPAGTPPGPEENLYLNYPTEYSLMPDGKLPLAFPPPFPDDGGIDPNTGLPNTAGANNQKVDPDEFYAVAHDAHGTVSGGVINITDPSTVIATQQAFNQAITTGNATSLDSGLTKNVILTGTADHPLVLHDTVAINGDVVITGYVTGTGSIVASGNVYVPTDLKYLDGHSYQDGDTPGNPTGPITFGIAPDGTKNCLGLACGGNMLIGDYLKPSVFVNPGPNDIITGNPDGPWNFTMAEISLFNRTEWSHTQPKLPGPGQDHTQPSTWTVTNPGYLGPNYVPRYYHFGPGDVVPIYNLGQSYFDPSTGTWQGDAEVPTTWDLTKLTLANPNNSSDPVLYNPSNGQPIAVVDQVTPTQSWIPNTVQKSAIEAFKLQHTQGTPMLIDGLLYTNNAIFGIARREDPSVNGQMVVNGSLVCADLGVLAPGIQQASSNNMPGSPFTPGLRLNYDKRTKSMLNVKNPNQVMLKRTLWHPTANIM